MYSLEEVRKVDPEIASLIEELSTPTVRVKK